jgi:hypothetical protein
MPKKGVVNNPKGRPAGSKNQRTIQWEALHDSIVDQHAASFNSIMDELLNHEELDCRIQGADLYLKMLEYFKPKLARQTLVGDGEANPVVIIHEKI